MPKEDNNRGKLISCLTRTLLAHILYMRGMIPTTIPHLEKYISNYEQERVDELVSSTKNRKEKKKALAASKFMNEMNFLLIEFESVITSSIEVDISSIHSLQLVCFKNFHHLGIS